MIKVFDSRNDEIPYDFTGIACWFHQTIIHLKNGQYFNLSGPHIEYPNGEKYIRNDAGDLVKL